MPEHVGVAAGAFVDQPLRAPEVEASCGKRVAWVTLGDPLAKLV